MKKRLLILFVFILTVMATNAQDRQWTGKWITCYDNQSATNSWLAFRKQVNVEQVPAEALAAIAVDSKYWLWINGQPVVREGALKRGPTPLDTYYDEFDLAPYLRPGENTVAVLVCYFGKDGFSHISSGKAGLLFDCRAPGVEIVSDGNWRSFMVNAYGTCEAPMPNFRLSESSILYDARKDPGAWQAPEYDDSWMPVARVFGEAGCYPWNKLVKRPVPQWKDFGLKQYISREVKGDTIVCSLPYNCQFTTYLKVRAPEGKRIDVYTDNYLYYDGAGTGLRSSYITRAGEQSYENPHWVNGHKAYYVIPEGVEVLDLQFRESGYDCEFSGTFSCSDPFFNQLWDKARRSLYITMRDNFMDCPDRERAQWVGDAVNESLEAYYCLSPSSHALVRKWLAETTGWQRADGVMFSPMPAGNWFDELPGQVLATIGYFGSWYYYLYTGDRSIIPYIYPRIQRYLDLWQPDGKGTMQFRTGDWTWGDWGDNRDMMLIYNLWYYLAVKGMYEMAGVMGYEADRIRYGEFMETFKRSFNEQFWNGKAYRHPDYTERTDDRVQALAVVAGIAEPAKYPAILKVFQTEEHASPYMEKYVFEAMMRMGYEREALERHRKRFGPMVGHPDFTTLFEGWGIGNEGFGGGTVNHGWSGGGLAVLSQYVCGVSPILPAFEKFSVLPQPGTMTQADIKIPTVRGDIETGFRVEGRNFALDVTVPQTTTAVVGIPKTYRKIYLDGTLVWNNGKYVDHPKAAPSPEATGRYTAFDLGPGTYKLTASR